MRPKCIVNCALCPPRGRKRDRVMNHRAYNAIKGENNALSHILYTNERSTYTHQDARESIYKLAISVRDAERVASAIKINKNATITLDAARM
jgi:hypothetical protein